MAPAARLHCAYSLRAGHGPDTSIPARFTDGGPLPFAALSGMVLERLVHAAVVSELRWIADRRARTIMQFEVVRLYRAGPFAVAGMPGR